jgi:hypothetical protein
MGVSADEMKPVAESLGGGEAGRLGDIHVETIQSQTADGAAAAGESAQIPAVAAPEINDQSAARVDLGENRNTRADRLLEKLGKICLKHRTEPGQQGFALAHHLLARTLAGAHQRRRYLSPTRNTAAAKRFLGKALNGLKDWEKPRVINTDKAPTYAAALAELKMEGKCPEETLHRQVKYLNNIIEADHGKLKQLIRPVRGFKTLKTAYATIKGFEVMRALRKGQASAFNITNDIGGEARIVERAFGLGGSILAEAVQSVSGQHEFEAA